MEVTIQINTMILILDILETIIVFLVGVGLGYYEGLRRKWGVEDGECK